MKQQFDIFFFAIFRHFINFIIPTVLTLEKSLSGSELVIRIFNDVPDAGKDVGRTKAGTILESIVNP